MTNNEDDWINRAREALDGLDPSEEKLCRTIIKGECANYQADCEDNSSTQINDPTNADGWGPDRTLRGDVIRWLCATSKLWNPLGSGIIEIRGAKIVNELRLDNMSIDLPLRLLRCNFQGAMLLRNARLHTIDLQGTCISPLNTAKHSCIKANEARIDGSVFLTNDFRANGKVNFDNSRVIGSLKCSGGRFMNRNFVALSAKGADIVGDLLLDGGFQAYGHLELRRTKVGGMLTIDPKIDSYESENDDDLDLRFAQIGTLNHNWTVWPKEGHLLLNGLVYNAFGPKFAKNNGQKVDHARWLQRQPQKSFSVQPYEQLAHVLRVTGDEAAAKKVLIAKQNDLRQRGNLGWFERIWNGILGFTIAHGYEPHRALLGMLFFFMLGSWIFGAAADSRLMSRTKIEEFTHEDYPTFNKYVYSLDAFVPFIDLKEKGYWIPDASKNYGGWVLLYLWIHIIAGWILTTLWVAGFSGLVRSGK